MVHGTCSLLFLTKLTFLGSNIHDKLNFILGSLFMIIELIVLEMLYAILDIFDILGSRIHNKLKIILCSKTLFYAPNS